MADTDQVLNLAAIIRKVDGNHSKGAAALAESILDHPNFRDVLARWGNPAPPASVDITTRNLLISLCSHMAYMQGQLEALHQLDDPDGHYWFRESVALRQKVVDHLAALADEPVEPEGREPAASAEQLSDEELLKLAQQYSVVYLLSDGSACHPFQEGYDMRNDVLNFAHAVLARWGNPAPQPVPVGVRPWEREGWCDPGGLCWLGSDALDGCTPTWLYGSPAWAERFPNVHRVLLPAQALPLPEVGE